MIALFTSLRSAQMRIEPLDLCGAMTMLHTQSKASISWRTPSRTMQSSSFLTCGSSASGTRRSVRATGGTRVFTTGVCTKPLMNCQKSGLQRFSTTYRALGASSPWPDVSAEPGQPASLMSQEIRSYRRPLYFVFENKTYRLYGNQTCRRDLCQRCCSRSRRRKT